MKKIIKQLCLMAFLLPALSAGAQEEKDSITLYLERNPNAVDYNIISEGSKIYLSADDKYLFINLSIANPTMQMRFLMQQASLYIDPTGKKKKRYKISLPSAPDVKEQLSMISGDENIVNKYKQKSPYGQNSQKGPNGPGGSGEEEERPDIRPLIRALNYWGIN